MKYFKTLFIVVLFCLSTVTVWAAGQKTSLTTATNIITDVRKYLNEPTTVKWSDTGLLRYINIGTMDIVARTHCLEGKKDQTLAIGTINYSISAEDYIFVRAVGFVTGGVEKGLTRGNLQSIGHVEDGGEPVYWTQEQDVIKVYPPPSATDSIAIYFIKLPETITASQSVLVPACYDRALILYVVAQAFYEDGQFAKAGRFMAEYEAQLDRFRSDFVTVPKESYDIIR